MDKKNIRIYITIGISLVLSVVLFKFFIKNVDINFLLTCVKSSNKYLIIMGGGLLILSHFLRAVRWTILLKPIQSTIKIQSSFVALLIGTLSNFIVPHLGEVMRCTALKKMENTGIEFSIGTVIAERVLDAIFLSFLILLGLFLNINALNLPPINASLLNSSLVFIPLIIVVPLFIFGKRLKNKLFEKISESLNQKIVNLKKGLTSIKQVPHLSYFILLSLAIWALYFLATYCLIKAIVPTEYVDFKTVLTVLIMSSIGWAGPTQGGIGTFHILVSKALVINGFDAGTSNMAALFLHTIFSSYDILYGILATAYLFIIFRPFKKYPSVKSQIDSVGYQI